MQVRTERGKPLRHRSSEEPSQARLVAVFVLYLLLIVSVIPWRSKTIYGGGLDVVVVTKALIAVMVLGAALLLSLRTRKRTPVGLGPAAVLSLVLLTSLLGSIVAGNASATIVLIIRVFLVMATVLLLLTTVPWVTSFVAFLSAMGAVGLVAAITGVPRLIATGRLGGGIPEVHPNEVAGLVGLPLVALVILMLRRGIRPWRLVLAVAFFAIAVASGSRTGLAAIVVAIGVAVLVNGIRNRSVVYALLACLPLGYGIATFTNAFGSLATRAGSTDTTSALDSRFDAWEVVLAWDWTEWKKWIGLGLSQKTVPVNIKWRNEQVLDSSWVSILAQSGLIGTILTLALVAWCVLTALVSARRRWLVLPLLTMVLFRSITESGLVDSALPFVTLMMLASVLTQRSRHGDTVTHRDLADAPIRVREQIQKER